MALKLQYVKQFLRLRLKHYFACLINNSRIEWSTEISMQILSFSDTLPQDALLLFKKVLITLRKRKKKMLN